MELSLTDEEAAVLRDFLGNQLGNLSMEISHTDNPAYRSNLRIRRDILRGVHDALEASEGAPDPESRAAG